ncbi:hypothetical protein CDL15_Pgr010757 [Punica granatum]|uniref:Uncharacterized protein n=1 Tax=Punica granatum TaxID=22663 RepID=A0A218W5N1_PUNGR|nr:hypothetical protein CDL15_Pgr010757 [Punica granatum]
MAIFHVILEVVTQGGPSQCCPDLDDSNGDGAMVVLRVPSAGQSPQSSLGLDGSMTILCLPQPDELLSLHQFSKTVLIVIGSRCWWSRLTSPPSDRGRDGADGVTEVVEALLLLLPVSYKVAMVAVIPSPQMIDPSPSSNGPVAARSGDH